MRVSGFAQVSTSKKKHTHTTKYLKITQQNYNILTEEKPGFIFHI